MTDREMERRKLIEAMARDAATYMCHDPDDWELMAGVCEAALSAIVEQDYAVVPLFHPKDELYRLKYVEYQRSPHTGYSFMEAPDHVDLAATDLACPTPATSGDA